MKKAYTTRTAHMINDHVRVVEENNHLLGQITYSLEYKHFDLWYPATKGVSEEYYNVSQADIDNLIQNESTN